MRQETYLTPDAFYMNVHTGSVCKGKEWEQDFEEREDQEVDWKDFGGDCLCEVELINNVWTDVE